MTHVFTTWMQEQFDGPDGVAVPDMEISARIYDILSALRGPDYQVHCLLDLKAEITARLRAIVFGVPEHDLLHWGTFGLYELAVMSRGDVLKVLLAAKDACEIRDRHDEGLYVPKSIRHFMAHTRKAIYATTAHPIWSGFGDVLHRALDPLNSPEDVARLRLDFELRTAPPAPEVIG